jgi:DNA polymerase phi
MITANHAILKQSAALSADVKKGVEILLSFGLLQTYGEDIKAYESLEVSSSGLYQARCADASHLLQDVVSCANVLSQPTASSSTSEAPLPPLDLLVDVLIAYLDKASNDLKSLASLVFGLVSSEVQPSTIEHLVAVSSAHWRYTSATLMSSFLFAATRTEQ